jgi:hypothetical protein
MCSSGQHQSSRLCKQDAINLWGYFVQFRFNFHFVWKLLRQSCWWLQSQLLQAQLPGLSTQIHASSQVWHRGLESHPCKQLCRLECESESRRHLELNGQHESAQQLNYQLWFFVCSENVKVDVCNVEFQITRLISLKVRRIVWVVSPQ